LGLRLNQNNLRVIGFNQELYKKQFLGKNVIRVGDVIVSVDNVTVRNAKELSKQIRTPLRIRFVRTNKNKIPKSYYMISPDRVVFFVPMMTSPLGLRLGRTVAFRYVSTFSTHNNNNNNYNNIGFQRRMEKTSNSKSHQRR